MPVIDYSTGQGRAFPRRAILPLLTALVLTAALFWWREELRTSYNAWRDARAARKLLHECLTYRAPADQVVYEEDPAAAKALLAKLDVHEVPVNYTTLTNSQSPGTLPFDWQVPVALTPRIWRRFADRSLLFQHQANAGILFLHERTSPSGNRRLVCVAVITEVRQEYAGLYDPPADWGMMRRLEAWSFPLDPEFSGETDTYPSASLRVGSGIDAGEITLFTDNPAERIAPPFPLRIFAGQPHPSDPARFTIRFELPMLTTGGFIEGRLLDDGTVRIAPDLGSTNSDNIWVPSAVPGNRIGVTR